MSANPSYLPSRIAEAVTVDRCGSIVNQLVALEAEPASKRYASTRQQRRQLALDLINEAQKLVDGLAEPVQPRKSRAAKPPKLALEPKMVFQPSGKELKPSAPMPLEIATKLMSAATPVVAKPVSTASDPLPAAATA